MAPAVLRNPNTPQLIRLLVRLDPPAGDYPCALPDRNELLRLQPLRIEPLPLELPPNEPQVFYASRRELNLRSGLDAHKLILPPQIARPIVSRRGEAPNESANRFSLDIGWNTVRTPLCG